MTITLVQISDTHIHDLPGADYKGTQPDRYLQRIVAHIKFNVTDLSGLVITGDLTQDGGADACKRLADCLRPLDCAVYVTPGNHDHTPTLRRHLLDERIVQPQKVDLGEWQLLFGDSHIENRVDGRIDEAELDELDRMLTKDPKPALLFTHHPPLDIQCNWLDEIRMRNGDTLIDRMLPHAHLRAVVFGHIHQHWDSHRQHLRLLGAPSTCVQFGPSEDRVGDANPGYRVLHLHENGLETRVLRCPMQIRKVVSGGQTGVDRAALDSAIALAIPHGGWCPSGRRALDGPIDAAYHLRETPSAGYPQRTEWNIRDSDGTLILSWGAPGGGSALTARLAESMKKPLKIIDLCNPKPIREVWQWLAEQDIRELNIAGPRHTANPNIYPLALDYVHRILAPVLENPLPLAQT